MQQSPFSPDLLKTIADPESSTGDRPTTNLTYGHSGTLNVDQVTSVGYVLNSSTTYQYSWVYFDDKDDALDSEGGEACNDHGDFATQVTDPNSAVTTMCFKPRDTAGGKAKDWTYDGEDRERTRDFNVDRQSEILTAGFTGSTVATYAAATPDQLNTVREPESDAGRNGKKIDIDYNHDGGGDDDPKGGKYLPGSVTDPNGDCVRYEYDSVGRITASVTDLRGSGSTRTCATASGGAKHTFEFNSDGTLAKSVDPNAGSSPTDAERTIYTYWATGDTGYVAGSGGLIKSVRQPGGDCSTGTSRKLCVSYTYDAAGRVASVTNGKGEKTSTQYDALDRTIAVMFGGTTSCALHTNCSEYTYDAEGNLTKREEKGGNTTFTYDRLNRQLTNEQPSSIDLTMSYDGAGNLTVYTQEIGTKSDTVTYVYDKGNVVDTVTDAAGTINVNADDDGNIEEYIFPGSTGIKIDLDTKDNGKTESATVLSNQGGTGASTLHKIAYDYTDGSDDEDQMQSRTTSSAGTDLNGTISYEYEYGRLASATDSSTAGPDYTYTLDKIGNITSEKIGSTTTYFGYDRAGELCWRGTTDGTKIATACPSTPAGDTTLNHDAAGNNTNTTGTNATDYNNRGQVEELGGIAMTYRDLGNDIRVKADGTTFLSGALGVTGSKVGFNTYTWYTRMPNGKLLNMRKGAATYNYFAEPQSGSVVAMYSPAGAQAANYLYSPYGQTTEGGTAAADNPFRYIGNFQDLDGPEDYYKLGARYYDGHGHFTQADPVGGNIADPKSLTAYAYAGGDPINSSDPLGRWIQKGDDDGPGIFTMVSITGCYVLCASVGVGGDGDFDLNFGVSFGPRAGVEVGEVVGKGKNEGFSKELTCALVIGAGVKGTLGHSQSDGFSGGGGAQFGGDVGCSVGIGFTF